ncbi:MAG: rhomboid family intramembrane serine protease [Jaaginema sp. PMC 1079.18]|nr:rhomboid family intramembrane serine protease [Jaaginema sp. PMC 1080.18]MEC4850671.1 rhomboid family intramembrane serine protease [Jaaginema sp. PMC 1079.18]MEC4866499.1 rhomboid family intramembrane serine protease [Jaaginema sp. PMC 1078.18]
MSRPDERSISSELLLQGSILGGMVAIFWVVEILDLVLFQGNLDRFGIMPHTLIGLRGIIFAPFLHGGLGHLIANTVPFLVLGWLVMWQRTSDFFIVTPIVMLVGGLGTWLLGGNAVHIGASGLIYGYFGFLLLRGFYERSLGSIILSLVVFFLYGSIIWGVLPSDPRISWQGHLFGFVGGVLAARFIGKRSRSQRQNEQWKNDLGL